MRQRIIQLGLIILIAIPLVITLRSFTQDYVMAIISPILRILRLFISSIPQLFFWFLFLSISLFIAGRSLIIRRRPAPTSSTSSTPLAGRVQALMHAIDRTSQGVYFKWRLAQHLLGLSLEAMAYRERVSPDELRQNLKSGTLTLPLPIKGYLQTGFTPVYTAHAGLFSRIKQRLRQDVIRSPLDLNLEIIIQFLEDQMEIEYDQ
jgi:hypothetical protein